MASNSPHNASENTNACSAQTERKPPFDIGVLEQLLNLGDRAVADALVEQLLSDFARIRDALQNNLSPTNFAELCRATHELKGLSSTIGARHLTQVTELVHSAAEAENGDQTQVFCGPLTTELDRVQAHLEALRDQGKGA